MSSHTFVIEAETRRIVVDTCAGNSRQRPLIPEFHHQHRPFLNNLTAAGFAPDTILIVVCTHLHVDHVGWNTRLVDGQWIPTFPLRVTCSQPLTSTIGHIQQNPLHGPAFADSVKPIIDAGLVDPVTADTALTPGTRLTRTPGHTPGDPSMWIADRCVITGDVLHHPIQCRHPEWTARGDVDPDGARATRSELLAVSAKTKAFILGTHFAGASAGRVHATKDGYRFTPEGDS